MSKIWVKILNISFGWNDENLGQNLEHYKPKFWSKCHYRQDIWQICINSLRNFSKILKKKTERNISDISPKTLKKIKISSWSTFWTFEHFDQNVSNFGRNVENLAQNREHYKFEFWSKCWKFWSKSWTLSAHILVKMSKISYKILNI